MRMHENATDEEIALSARKYRQDFAILVERYQDKLLRYIRRIGAGEEAEDLLQEIFINAFRYLNGFDPSLSFSSWIYRIAHNTTISAYRKKKIRPHGNLIENGDEFLANIGTDEDIATELETKCSVEEINNALLSIKQKYRDVVVLRYVEELEYKEISDVLKIPMGSVASLLSRAKKNLKDEISGKSK